MSVIAGVVVDAFAAKLEGLFPEARVLSSVFEWQPTDKIALLIAPVKGEARVRAKVLEYAEEFGHDIAQWPFVQCVGDLVRASIVCADMDGVVAAWQRVESAQGFDVRDGHGRLKNNWLTREPRPPDMLVNVVVDVSDAPSITGEIQIHLYEILLAKEEGHHLYEITRAASVERLLDEASGGGGSSMGDDVEAPIVDGSKPTPAVRAASFETVCRRFAGWMRFSRPPYASIGDDGAGCRDVRVARDTAPIDVRVDDALRCLPWRRWRARSDPA